MRPEPATSASPAMGGTSFAPTSWPISENEPGSKSAAIRSRAFKRPRSLWRIRRVSPPMASVSAFPRSISSSAGPHPPRSSPNANSDPSHLQFQQVRRSPAIDRDDLTGNEAGHRAAEKQREIRDVRSMTLQAEGVLGAIVAIGDGFGKSPHSFGPSDRSRRDRVDSDAVGPPFHGAR